MVSSCLKEETRITTDFDYVKLTETTVPLSPFYCKGVIRGMPFSYSTHDPFYAVTHFPKASTNSANIPYLMFTIGEFGNYMPIWFYIQSSTISLTEFIHDKLVIGAEYPMGVNDSFIVYLHVLYTNEYISSARYFYCCTPENTGILKIANVEYLDEYTAVTFQFSGKLYSSSTEGHILYFGDAFVEMRIRIDP